MATAVALMVGGSWFWSDRNAFATRVGEQRVIPLADGSSLSLDTDSRVRVRFTDRQRRIDLVEGQALFNVEHDAGRPFVVYAGKTRVTAVGTVFDVRRAGEEVRVTLVSGAIDVQSNEASSPPRRIAAGQQVRVSGAEVDTRAVDVESAVSYTHLRAHET